MKKPRMTPRPLPFRAARLPVTLLTLLSLGAQTLADETRTERYLLAPVTVVGWQQDQTLLPGTVTIVSEETLQRIQPRSTEDVLRTIPGIFIKGEEENAVVLNAGVRGLPAGDYKTLILEDGVPVQPGIFVGNSRYYNPRVQRMAGVEVLRGAASLRHGPNTIGGVINFITRMPEDGVSLTGRIGSWNTREGILEVGGSNPEGDARFGVILTRNRSDGFMDRSYDLTDLMVRTETAIGDNQILGLKFLYYETEANISYRGLFPEAFRAGERFNPAPDDWFLTERKALDLTHEWQIRPGASLHSIFYWSEMNRDYWRFQLNSDAPTRINENGFRVWNFSDEVQGNNRSFTRFGADTRLTLDHETFGRLNASEFGIRIMEEEMLDQTIRADRATPRNPNGALQRNRLDSAVSLALFAQNRVDLTEAFAVTAGVRVETYEQKREDLRRDAPADRFSNTEVMPGLGATYWISPNAQVFASVYRAFAPPLVGSVVGTDTAPTDAETSINLEAGIRGSQGRFTYEMAVFQMDFSNQVDPGVSGIRNPNEGSALIQGVEAAVGVELPRGFRIDSNVTWVPTAEFGEDRPGEALEGNRLQDSPEWVGNLILAHEQGRLQTALIFNYTGAFFGDGLNRHEFTTEASGTWGGRVSSYFTLDLTARFAVTENLNLFGAVNNLTDEQYVSGLRQGLYVGPERNFSLGARYTF